MKRLCLLLAILMCCAVLAVAVSARSGANQLHSQITVTKDGGCSIRISTVIHLDEAVAEPEFPIPQGAADVTLNGAPMGLVGSRVPLKTVTGGMAGDFSIVITYTLNGVVAADDQGVMTLTLPILSGFAYPIESLELSVTLPGTVTTRPSFFSGYHQEGIESLMNISVDGSAITAVTTGNLKDHETLVMTLPVGEELFPQTAATARVLGWMDIAVIAAAVLAVVYYFLALRPALPKRVLRSTAPDSMSAGDLEQWFTGGGIDLSLLVVAWAQRGYLRIQLDDSGRVLLHKMMSMGNERSAFENRLYKNLFGKRRIVDGTGYHYAQLCREAAKKYPRSKEIYRQDSGNPGIFRGLCALAAGLSGFGIGGALAPQSLLLELVMAAATTALAVGLQFAGIRRPRRSRLPLSIGLGCALAWIGLGLWSGEWIAAVIMVVFQFVAGIATAYGGRRTELGQQALGQILGLRKHMRTVSKKELQRLLKLNPGYFHELAPYALALGVDRSFARRFERLRLQECSYLIWPKKGQTPAAEWANQLRNVVSILDAKANQLPFEKFLGR